MSVDLESILARLKTYVEDHTAGDCNYPTGIEVSLTGRYYNVRWSKEMPTYHETLPGAATEIDEFLKQHDY